VKTNGSQLPKGKFFIWAVIIEKLFNDKGKPGESSGRKAKGPLRIRRKADANGSQLPKGEFF
jgi:hypothetical protein